jgi:hypothetical protein
MTQGPRTEPSSEAQAAKLRGILESAVTAILTIDDRGLIERTVHLQILSSTAIAPSECATRLVSVLALPAK